MASLMVPPANEKKRVKVYELKDNDWYDRGTGFCTGRVVNASGNVRAQVTHNAQRTKSSSQEESRIYVESEDEPDRLLLETKIGKDDGYQKQQGTAPQQHLSVRSGLSHFLRYPHSLDRVWRNRYGPEFSGG